MNKLWKILNSNVAILVLGFLLTGVLGAWLTDRFQEASWRRQAELEAQRRAYEWEREKTFELLRHRLQEGLRSLENVSETMNRRLFMMEKAFNVVRKKSKKPPSELWAEYEDAVDEWNIKLKYYEEDLRRLVGDEFADELNDYETDQYTLVGHCPDSANNVRSIHSKFWCANRSLDFLITSELCAERGKTIRTTADLIRALNYQTDAFVARAGSVFLDRSAELEQFKFHPASKERGRNN